MDDTAALRAPRGQDISDTHARGLRRDLFRYIQARLALQVRSLQVRMRQVQLPQRSVRDANAAYFKAREAMYRCGGYWNERVEGRSAHSCSILLYPDRLAHASGDEPVLDVSVLIMSMENGRASFTRDACGRISHHAVERMYQRLRTSSHDVVWAELRSALGWTMILRNAALLSARAAAIHQLPVPTDHGALRCICDPGRLHFEARTFTLNRPDGRIAASVQAIQRWGAVPADDRADAFDALLRDRANRWWRQPHAAAAVDALR